MTAEFFLGVRSGLGIFYAIALSSFEPFDAKYGEKEQKYEAVLHRRPSVFCRENSATTVFLLSFTFLFSP